MAKGIHLLTALEVRHAADGDHNDGGGLWLRVTTGGAVWVFRYTSPTGRRREMGLGVCQRPSTAAAGVSAVGARERARQARLMLERLPPVDPIEERNRERTAASEAEALRKAEVKRDGLTLARACRAYHEQTIAPRRSDKHAREWLRSLENHMPANLWHRPATEIEAPELLDFIVELNSRIPETAMRLRQRLETVYDDLVFRKLATANPAAAIRRKLREFEKRRPRTPHRALPFGDVPAFLVALKKQPGIAARALEFGLLTAARTGEIIGATWSEIDTDAAVWTVPAARMKGAEEHRVHLSARALAILEGMRELGSEYVFPSSRDLQKPLSNMAMLVLLKRMKYQDRTTAHGICRASFSTWANETGIARPDGIEATLAHREGDRIRAAYNRSKFNAERRRLLEAWSAFCNGESNVISIDAHRAERA